MFFQHIRQSVLGEVRLEGNETSIFEIIKMPLIKRHRVALG